jgi:IMP dehydrogenase
MKFMKKISLALTYEDVLLIPKRTPLKSRGEADVKSYFTRNIPLNTPFVSANMSTVTEHKMAIAMAREGGLGIIHQFGSIADQVEEIKKVKKSTSYVIENPITVTPRFTLQEAINTMRTENVTSVLVMSGEELVGILTHRDYLFEQDLSRPVREVMVQKDRLITAEYGIDLNQAKKILHQHRIEKLPLLENGRVRGLITTQDISKLEYWPHASRDKKGRLMVGGAVGVKDTLERGEALVNAGVDVLVLDVAHAHSDFVIERLRELKNNFAVDVMVGNIATGEAAQDLIEAGADGLKVGIGPSPVCTTRVMSGAGIPQLTAVMNVVEVARQYNIPVTADGGMKYPGDVAKAIAAGASSIFSGSLFAGTDEAPGLIIMKDGKRYKKYAGSASYESNHLRKENQVGHRVREKMDVFVEGISTLVDYKGLVEDVVHGLKKGLQSAISYCGASNISQMQANAEFVRITPSGWHESLGRGNKVSE